MNTTAMATGSERSDTPDRPDPVRIRHEAFAVAGPTARTTNRAEADPSAARIGALWERFFSDGAMTVAHRTADARNFGVYSGYESDADGAFDVTAGVAVSQGGGVTIPAGDYLVFSGHGAMPQAVLDLWCQARDYFERHPAVERRFVADFEAYTSPVDVTVWVGIA